GAARSGTTTCSSTRCGAKMCHRAARTRCNAKCLGCAPRWARATLSHATAVGRWDVVSGRAVGYALALAPSAVDIVRFDTLASLGHEAMKTGDATRARELLDQALSIWRGDPLVDFAYEEFAQGDIARLAEARLVATEVRIDAELALGGDITLISELEQLVGAHPLREHLHAQLMLALSRSGRQADALRVYQRARDVLGADLGLEPSAELRELEVAILQQEQSV